MSEALSLVFAFAGGGLLGAFFFGGLWWTIHLGLLSKVPAVWFLASLVLRTGTVVGGFYLISQKDWRHLIACLLGFLIVRVCVTRINHNASLCSNAKLTKVSS